jgi:RNA polymerase sigma-70 factor, ECF subfamily
MLVVAEREELPVSDARAGSPEAWSVLFKRYQLPLYVYVVELVHDEQTALDVVQETFVNASRYISNLRDNEKFGSWLFGIAHQKCIQRWRQQNREPIVHEDSLSSSGGEEADHDSPDELLIRREQEAEFMKLLNSLPLPQRSVLLLYCIEEFSIEEIAAISAIAIGTVKSRLHYAKKAFRKLLENQL